MDAWPADNRTEAPSDGKRKRQPAPIRNYPYIEQGLTNVVALVERNGRFEWDSLVRKEFRGPILRTTTTQTLFPATRPPPLQIPRTSDKERAEHGANFLRTYHPDIEVSSELIRDEITADEIHCKTFRQFNPYAGNLLASVVPLTTTSKPMAYLCFPMGELNTDLNISPLKVSKTGTVAFTPNATPVRTFDTPIQQVVASTSRHSFQPNQGSFLAVRTFGPTYFYLVSPKATIQDLPVLPTSLTEDQPLVDIKLDASSSQAYVVNHRGSVFHWNMPNGKPVNSTRPPSEPYPDAFWRLALTRDIGSLLLSSSKTIQVVDFRSPQMKSLFDLRVKEEMKDDMVTSIEDISEDHIIRLGTTTDILWLDDRFPGRPLLGMKHGRHYDRTLFTETVSISGSPFTLLSSRNRPFVSVYDIGYVGNHRLQANCRPYCLILDNHNASYAGQAFLNLPSEDSGISSSINLLSSTGCLTRIGLALENQATSSAAVAVRWSDAVTELQARSSLLRADAGPMGAQDRSQVDLREAYQAIFHDHFLALSCDMTNPVVSDVIGRMPSFWQESSAPMDHILTTYDIAFRTGDEPSNASRADFLTPNHVNSPSGYEELTRGGFTTQALAKDAKWHYSLAKTFDRLDVDTMFDFPHNDRFTQFNIAPHPDRTSFAIRMETEARHQLTLDLSLGSDIFSGQPFARPETDFDTMSRATEALSLGGEPPPIEYSYLTPIISHRGGDETDDDTPLGVRLLLKEWSLGTDPADHVYEDPYDDLNAQSPPTVHNQNTTARPDKLGVATQRPPIVVAARPTIKSQPETMGGPRLRISVSQAGDLATSQPALWGEDWRSYSQDHAIASTQVMPGPFGGRPVAAKKSGKKRLGGF